MGDAAVYGQDAPGELRFQLREKGPQSGGPPRITQPHDAPLEFRDGDDAQVGFGDAVRL